MANRTKQYLQQEFRDGERPSGGDFADIFDSFIHKSQDGVTFDTGGNIGLQAGLTIGNSTRETAGTMRFNGAVFQFYNGSAWQDLGTGSGGGFTPVGATLDISYNSGSVGIGTGVSAPAFRLEVEPTANGLVRFGRTVTGGIPALPTSAIFSHRNLATQTNYALQQSQNGTVTLNCPSTQSIIFSHGDVRQMTLVDGRLLIGTPVPLNADATYRLHVSGSAFKSEGGGSWNVPSDKRLKKDIAPFTDGLDKLKKVKPVQFKYNGKAWTKNDEEAVGIIGQDMEKIFPYMVSRTKAKLEEEDTKETELLTFNDSAFLFVIVNAIKELADKIDKK
jgi:hypothetical protein